MNSKALLLVLAVIVVGGGIFAIKNLQTDSDSAEQVESRETTDKSEAAAGSSSSSGGARVSAINEGRSRNDRRPLADRQMRRNAGAAALDVTPATTSSAAAAAAQTQGAPEGTLEEKRSVADLTNLFKSTTDVDRRIEIAEEIGLIDSPESIRSALELLRDEKDPLVQEALIEAMQGLESQDDMADEIYRQVSEIYMKTDNDDVKLAAQDLMGDLATPEAAAGLRQVMTQGAASGEPSAVHVNAAENLLRISQSGDGTVTPEERTIISQGLKEQYSAAGDAAYRQQIIMALATEGRENSDFFQQALETEQDPQNREMLQRLVRMFNSPPPATPPPGTIVTPVPTPM